MVKSENLNHLTRSAGPELPRISLGMDDVGEPTVKYESVGCLDDEMQDQLSRKTVSFVFRKARWRGL